jgi:hypothetical protein
MRTWPYRIATLLILALCGGAWSAALTGWGLRGSASTRTERDAIRSHSARVGGRVLGGGTHFGK